MKLVIFFQSLVDESVKGYFTKFQKTGFLASTYVNNATIFNSRKGVDMVLKKLEQEEGQYYKFEVWEVL